MTKPKKRKNYLNNKSLLAAVIESKTAGKISPELAKLFMLLVNRFAKKGNFVGYTYNEDMQGLALVTLCHTWHRFNPEISQNPFAFYTQCVKNAFLQYINKERKHRDIRDKVMVSEGLNPSFTYADTYENERTVAAEKEKHKKQSNYVEDSNIIEY